MASPVRPVSDVAKAKQRLVGLNAEYQTTLSTISVAQANAENTTLSRAKREESRRKYEQAQAKLETLKGEIADLERQVTEGERTERADKLRKEVRTLKTKYDAKLDKRSPESIELKNELDEKTNQLNAITGKAQAPGTGFEGTATEFLRERGAPLPGESKPKRAEVVMGGADRRGGGAKTTGAADTTATTTPEKDKEAPKKSKQELYEEALLQAQEKYNMPDIIFNNVPSLGEILKQFVEGKFDINGFRFRIENDPWYRQNSQQIRNRYLQIFNYNDLKSKGQAVGTTAFEQELRRISENIQDQAVSMTGSRITDEDAVEAIAKDLYTYGLEGSANEIRQRIAKFIRPITSRIGERLTEGFGGEAKANYDALYAAARANGFTLEDILPKDAEGNPIPTAEVLQRIATGKLDVNRIQDDIRRLAAQGRPDYVKDLLAQGTNLDEIYLPYKMQMAKTLEIADLNSIDLKDPSLQMGITKDGDMNLFDYEKALRKDKRWQYTESARDEVASVLDTVLRDFGFRS